MFIEGFGYEVNENYREIGTKKLTDMAKFGLFDEAGFDEKVMP